VIITYPIDPHVGMRLPIWRTSRTRDGDVLIVDTPEGYRRRVPVEWTDLRPTKECPRIRGRPVLLDATRLLIVTSLVVEKLTDRIGGSELRQPETDEHAPTSPRPRSESDPGRGVRRLADRGTDTKRGDRALARRDGSPRGSHRRRKR
jgi:hypothetical protein